MIKEYSLQDLASILGCSRTAIAKKIKPDISNPDLKRYKNRYDVVTKEGKMFIAIDDNDLEEEKRLSKGFNNVLQNGYDTPETDNIIDIEPIKQENTIDKIFNFTERYINDFKTFQAEMYNELQQRDKQVLLLTNSENNAKNEYLKVIAENKTLKTRNVIITVVLTVMTTLLIVLLIGFITFINISNNVSAPEQNSVIEQLK